MNISVEVQHKLWDLLFQLLILIVTAGGSVLGYYTTRWVKNKRAADALQQLGERAKVAVLAKMAEVQDKKDPSKPNAGPWIKGLSGANAKAEVVEFLVESASPLIEEAFAHLKDPATVAKALEQVVEAQVQSVKLINPTKVSVQSAPPTDSN